MLYLIRQLDKWLYERINGPLIPKVAEMQKNLDEEARKEKKKQGGLRKCPGHKIAGKIPDTSCQREDGTCSRCGGHWRIT